MRRSAAVKLTILPVLAAAATAAAQPADPYAPDPSSPDATLAPGQVVPQGAPVSCDPRVPMNPNDPNDPNACVPTAVGVSPDAGMAGGPGAMMVLMPPGMAPVVQVPSCEGDPTWPGCRRDYGVFAPHFEIGVIRGGFGTYFGTGGG